MTETSKTLERLSLRMAQALELDEVLGAITRGLVADLDAALARIWLIQPDEPDTLVLVASAGLSESLVGSRSRVPVGTLKIGEIAQTRQPVRTTTALAEDPRFIDKDWMRTNDLVAFAGYPLLYRDELLGVLAMFARRGIDDGERDQLELFAAHAAIAIKNARLFAAVHDLTRRLEADNAYLREKRPTSTRIIGESAAIMRALAELERVAPTSSTVLIHGETGTGKELFARALHEKSSRRNGPLVRVNCAALAPSLVESELFGHERGAFTGATQKRIGRFELAHGGTLFLDEISELPLEAQAKLLRVLQERELERVGGMRSIKVDVRIVAATNRDLAAQVQANRFRSDLYYRLNVFPLTIPPLRDRREDIPMLAATFLGGRHQIPDEATIAYLQAYDWPGNVRELQNVLERAAILAPRSAIGMAELPELPAADDAPKAEMDVGALSLKERVNAYERSLVVETLRLTNDNQSEAARLLRMSRATLQYKMRLHRL